MSLCSLRTAQAAVSQAASPLAPKVRPLWDAHGQLCAEDVFALRAVPACDVAAMDGYALHAADSENATRANPRRLSVVARNVAGAQASREVARGETARIFTGAPLPPGADAVLRQEGTVTSDTTRDTQTVLLGVEVPLGKDIRRAGEDVPLGALLVPRGARLDAAALALLASQGLATVKAYPAPRVAVLTTGDELLAPGQPAAAHQVYESNLVLVCGLCAEAGARVVATSKCPDDDRTLRANLEQLLHDTDVLVTTGGASVGERDRVKTVLTQMGAEFRFNGVALKPGKPAALAEVGGRFILVLPGTPGAAATAFDQLGRRLLLALQGALEVRRTVRVRLDGPQSKQAGLTYLLGAKVSEDDEGRRWATVRPRGGALLHLRTAEGYVVLPPGRADFARGDEVVCELFAGAQWVPHGPPA